MLGAKSADSAAVAATAAPPRPLRRPWPAAVAAATPRAAPVAAVLLGLGFAALTSWRVLAEYGSYHGFFRDFGIYVQLAWSNAHGQPFQSTLLSHNRTHLAEHVALAMLPLALLQALLPDPRLLIVLQQAALALSGLPIYLLARRRLPGTWAPLVVLAAFYCGAQFADVVIFDGFYPVALAVLPLSFGMYFMLTQRPGLGAAIACLTLLLEETSALALLGLGALLMARRQFRLGLLVSGVAIAWLALVTLVVMPAFQLPESAPDSHNRTFSKFNDLLAGPDVAWQRLAERGPAAAAWLLGPDAGLPLLSPAAVLAALPTALALLFAENSDYLYSHRATPLIPLLWMAAVEGLARLRGGWRLRLGLGAFAACAVGWYLVGSALPGGGRSELAATRWTPTSAAMAHALPAVPPDASVGASGSAMAHLARRGRVWLFPGHYDKVLWPRDRLAWWVLDVSTPPLRAELKDATADRRGPLAAKPAYQLWLVDDALLLASDDLPLPARPAQAEFGRTLRLERYDLQRTPDGARVQLAWRMLARTKAELTRRLVLLDVDGRELARHDGPSAAAGYGPAEWRGGQLVVEDFSIPLAAGDPAALRVQWLERASGAPLPLADGATELVLPANAR